MEGRPLYIDNEFKRGFEFLVVMPNKDPKAFHPQLIPVQWFVAVFGRAGTEKREVCRKLLQGFPSVKEVNVRIGHTNEALDEISASIQAADEIMHPEQYPRHIILVDHADVLVYEPDSNEALLRAMQLKAECTQHRVMLIALFDRVPGDFSRTDAWLAAAQKRFFQEQVHQFARLLLSAPSHAFRKELFKYYFDALFGEHFKAKVTLALSEQDYEVFADHSSFATSHDIFTFVQRVGYDVVRRVWSEGGCALEPKDILTYMASDGSGIPHLHMQDGRDAENWFRTSVGASPLVAPSVPKVRVEPGERVMTQGEARLETVLEQANKRIKIEEEKN